MENLQVPAPSKASQKLDWKIDRELPVSITEQLKGQIIYAISFGTLLPGDPLPSVRELARTLQVSPVTASKVYQQLTTDGLLVTKPYIGVFVNELGLNDFKHQSNVAQVNLRQILENAIRQARLMGYSHEEIHQVFLAVNEQSQTRAKRKRILMVGNYRRATVSYAKDISGILVDLNIEVIPVTLPELVHDFDQWKDLLKQASLVVTVPQRLRKVRALIEPEYCRVIAIAYELSPITIQKLSAIQSHQRVGIVSTLPDFVQTMVHELDAYGLNVIPPLTTTINQTERIIEMLKQIDILIYATGSEKVLEWLPENVEAFEFLHTPKAESVNRLRHVLY